MSRARMGELRARGMWMLGDRSRPPWREDAVWFSILLKGSGELRVREAEVMSFKKTVKFEGV